MFLVEEMSSPSSGASAVHAQKFSGDTPDEVIVYWLDIALFGVLAVFVLAAIPRLVGRFSVYPELKRGLILRTGSSDDASARRRTGIAPMHHSSSSGTVESDQSRTLADHIQRLSSKEYEDSSVSPPLHVPSLSTLLYPISTFFVYSITPGKTLGKVALSLIYITGILFVVFFSSDPLADPARLGDIAVSQIPFVVALGTKNNIIGILLSKGYERVSKRNQVLTIQLIRSQLNYFHRLVGVVIFATANFHALGYREFFDVFLCFVPISHQSLVYKYAIAGDIDAKLRTPFIIWGIFALLGIELLFVFSLNFFRQRFYVLFMIAHGLGLFLFLLCVCPSYARVFDNLIMICTGVHARPGSGQVCRSRCGYLRVRPYTPWHQDAHHEGSHTRAP